MLSITGLAAGYGPITALRHIDLTVGAGEFVAILGPNGAGKSTLIKTIAGGLRPSAGSISFEGAALERLTTAQRIRRGIGVIPEGRQLFFDMSVRENLILGNYARSRIRIPRQIEAALADIFAKFPRLRERAGQSAGSLSGGEAQMLAIGRALMARPRLLLCDEPSLGLAPMLVREMLAALAWMRDAGMTVLLADQNAHAALRIADRAYILDTGRVVAAGPSTALANDPALRAAYLGHGMA